MKEYKGFQYAQLPNGGWKILFPGGGVLKTPKQTEEQLLAEIDTIISQGN